MENIQIEKLYSVSKAALYMGKTAQGIHYLIKTGKLKATTLNGKYKYVNKDELDSLK